MRQAKRGEHRTDLSTIIDPDSGYIKWGTNTDGTLIPENDTIFPDRELPFDTDAQHKVDLVWCVPCGHVYYRDGITFWMNNERATRDVPCPLCGTAIQRLETIGFKPTQPLYTRPITSEDQQQPSSPEQECNRLYNALSRSSAHWHEQAHERRIAYEEALRDRRMSSEQIRNLQEQLAIAEEMMDNIKRGIIRNRQNYARIRNEGGAPGASRDNPLEV